MTSPWRPSAASCSARGGGEQKVNEDIAAMEADLAQLRVTSRGHGERRAKLQKKLDQLQARIKTQQMKATERREAFAARQKAKHAILKNKAAAAGKALKDLATTPV